jgi:hypothetical protein
MALPLLAAGAGALLGGIGGLFKSGPDMNMFGRNASVDAFNAYKNLAANGPGAKDVTAAYDSAQDYSKLLGNVASNGLYDSAAGNRLAEQQFAPQRQALAQSLQDQMAQANRAASAAGRSTNDPILRARLGAEAMRQTASLSSQQSSAAMDLGRQSTLDMLNTRGQQTNLLQSLAQEAFSNQNTLFGMGSNIQQMDSNQAQYENSRGGGLKGAITGAITGAGAGLQMAQGFANIDNAGKIADSTASFNKALPGILTNMSKMGANMTGPSPASVPMQMAPSPSMSPYFNPMNFAQNQASAMNYSPMTGYTSPGTSYAQGVSNSLMNGTANPNPTGIAGFDPNSRWNSIKNWWGNMYSGSLMDR